MITSHESTLLFNEQLNRERTAIREKVLMQMAEDEREKSKTVTKAIPKLRQDIGKLFGNLGQQYEAGPHIGLRVTVLNDKIIIWNKADGEERFFVEFPHKNMIVKELDGKRELVLEADKKRMETCEAKDRLAIVIPLDGNNYIQLRDAVVKYLGTRRELKGGSVMEYVRFSDRQSQPLSEWLVDNFDSVFRDAFQMSQRAYAEADPTFRVGGGYQSMIDADPTASRLQKEGFAEMAKIRGIFADKVAGDYGLRGFNEMFMRMAIGAAAQGKRVAGPAPNQNM